VTWDLFVALISLEPEKHGALISPRLDVQDALPPARYAIVRIASSALSLSGSLSKV